MSVFNRGTNIIVQPEPSFSTRQAIAAAVEAEASKVASAASAVATAADRVQTGIDRAATAADAAATAEDRVQTGLDASAAEAARDAAFVNASVYSDTSAGLAATTEGDQFQVVSGVGDEVIRYRHDAGPVATEVARYPTSNALDTEEVARIDGDAANARAITRTNLKTGQAYPMPPGLGISDGVAALNDSGDIFVVTALTTDASNVENGRIESRKSALPPGLGVSTAVVSDDNRIISAESIGTGAFVASEDANGDSQIFWHDGDVRRQVTYGPENKQPMDFEGSFVRDTVPGRIARGSARRVGRERLDDNVLRVAVVYGQSLALGHNGVGDQYSAWWTTTPNPSSVLMLSVGINPIQNNSTVVLVESELGTLVPAQGASSIPPVNNNDVSALPLALAVQEENGGAVVAGALGRGGATVAELSKGTDPYNNLLTWLNRVVSQAAVQYPAKTVRVEVLAWCQGESDGPLTVAQYTTARDQLFTDLTADFSLITGQATAPVYMVGQTAALTGGSARSPAYAAADGTHVCYGPQYAINGYVDVSHLDPRGYTDLGAQMGAAYQWRRIDQRLRPTAATLIGDQILVTFAVPVGRIVLDPSITDDGRLGINYRDSTSSAAVKSAQIIGPDQVLVQLTAPPTGTSRVLGIADRGTGNPGKNSGARSPLCDQAPRFNPVTGEWMPNRALVYEIAVS